MTNNNINPNTTTSNKDASNTNAGINNSKSKEQAKRDGQPPSPPPLPSPGQLGNMPSRNNNTVFKSGPLFISSKGIGWTSWKKRWFILTRNSLVFFRSDPNAAPQKGSEVNVILGGIDLNNSGSVVVKADKKLLTVLFPDGRDGRTFTLKAETSEDLYEWKTALDSALALAPSATPAMGQNGVFKNDQTNAADVSQEQMKDKQPAKSSVVGRPILLALEDADGSPSFLEKALRYIEDYGIKVEGILRQAADVDEVNHRIREYEQGKTEFSAAEDAHVIGDCIKYILREMPSSPVPASCCTALLEAYRTDRNNRINNIRGSICETFPDPNRRLLQRILLMMQAVASNKAETRMSVSAVAACMAPLLLRPLLAGDCEIDADVNVGGDNSLQLLRAAAAANHAQAIVITLLEEYSTIFGEVSMTDAPYSDSEDYGSEDELVTDDYESYEDDEDYEDDDASQGSDAYTDEDHENASSRTYTETGDSGEDDLSENKERGACSSSSPSEADNSLKEKEKPLSNSVLSSMHSNDNVESNKSIKVRNKNSLMTNTNEPDELLGNAHEETALNNRLTARSLSACTETSESDGRTQDTKQTGVWKRTPARKKLTLESDDFLSDDEAEIQRLEAIKLDLQRRLAEEVQINAVLQAKLDKQKKALNERRLALEQDVTRLQEQLQQERDKRAALEAFIYKSEGPCLLPAAMADEKLRADLEEIAQAEADIANLKQKIDDFSMELYQQRDSSRQPVLTSDHQAKLNDAGEAATSELPGRSASKDISAGGADPENDKKRELNSSTNKCPPQNQQLVLARKYNSRSSALTNSGRSDTRSERDICFNGAEAEKDKYNESTISPKKGPSQNQQARRSNSKSRSYSRKSSAKSEGPLTKLTTRLNFLKERRNQIASELQNLDKRQGSGQDGTATKKAKGSEPRRSHKNQEKGKVSEVYLSGNPETGGRVTASQSSQKPDNGSGKEGDPVPSSERT